MRYVYIGVSVFATCFVTGSILSLWFGLDSSQWVPAGLATSTFVGYYALRKARN
jgi:hypothetical protein